MPSYSSRLGQLRGRSPPTHFTALFAAFLNFLLCGVAQPALARLERQTYVSYRTPHLCSYQMMESVKCGDDKPMCCVASSAIRCCAGTTACGNCTDDIVGYEMPKSSVILGCFSLSILILLGSIIMSGVGRHLAWVLERRRVIENYRQRLVLRRAEAREFKKELTETEVKDIEDSVACVICCARHIDVALTPCGHVCCCRFCAKRLKECPVCRGGVQRCFNLPLYYVKQLVKAAEEEECGGSGGVNGSPSAVATARNAESSEEAATSPTRECDAANAGVHLSSSGGGRSNRLNEDTEDKTAAAPTYFKHFNPFNSKRYTLLLNEEDEDDDSSNFKGGAAVAVSAAPTVHTVPTATAVAPLSAGETGCDAQPSATHRDSYVSVAK